MKRLTIGVRGLLAFSILGAGCTQTAETPPAAEMTPAGSATDSGHTHGSGPNGGVVFDLGAYHAEFGVDHGKQQVTVLMLGADMKSPLPVAATELIAAMHETKTAAGLIVPPGQEGHHGRRKGWVRVLMSRRVGVAIRNEQPHSSSCSSCLGRERFCLDSAFSVHLW